MAVNKGCFLALHCYLYKSLEFDVILCVVLDGEPYRVRIVYVTTPVLLSSFISNVRCNTTDCLICVVAFVCYLCDQWFIRESASVNRDVIHQRFHLERSVSSLIWLCLFYIYWSVYLKNFFIFAIDYIISPELIISYVVSPFLYCFTTSLSRSEWKKYWQSIRIIYIGVITSLIIFQALWAFFAALDMVSHSELQYSEWCIIRYTIALNIFENSVSTYR